MAITGHCIVWGDNDKSALFLHIPRTGGRSVFGTLGIQRGHITAALAVKWFPKDCRDGAMFAMVREPKEHALAWWRNLRPEGTVEEFREWVRQDYTHARQPLARGKGAISPLAQAEWLSGNESVTIFTYPHIQEAVDWATDRCGVLRKVVKHIGDQQLPVDWREWYDNESEAIVELARAEEYREWFGGIELKGPATVETPVEPVSYVPSKTKRASVLINYDVDGWAQHRHAMGLQKYAPEDIRVDIGSQLQKLQERQAYDAVYIINLHSAGAKVGRRLVSCVASHAWLHKVYGPADWRTRGVNKWRNSVVGAGVLRYPRAVICRNRELEKWARQYCKSVKTIPAGVDTDLFVPQEKTPGGRLVVGWCGQVSGDDRKDFKGYKEILLPLVRRLGSRYRWIINKKDAVSPLSQEDMVEWYNGLDVFLTTASAEGTPNPPFEAAACGVPVIGTPVGQLADWKVWRGACSVSPYHNEETAEVTINELVEQLARFDEDLGCWADTGEELLASIHEDYSYSVIAPKTLRFILGEDA